VLTKQPRYYFTGWQQFCLVLLRWSIGWHFLREGWVKLMHPTWTAKGYLMGSWGPFAEYFRQIGNDPLLLQLSDIAMPWLLTLSGIGLMLGLFTRISTLVAMGLLVMFYCAAPPFAYPYAMDAATMTDWSSFFAWMHYSPWAGNHIIGSEGNYAIVNKNLIEFIALLALLAVNSGQMCGLDPLLKQWFGKKRIAEVEPGQAPQTQAAAS
jgi:thiosulfate dehydrogenase [quinone] large subunit